MKRICFTLFASCFYMVINAQQTDSLDNIVFKIQPGWKVVKQSSFTELTLMDKNIRGFCKLAIYRQQASSANRQKDFEKEWKELVERNFTMITLVKPIAMKDKLGNSFLRYGAKGIGGDGNKYFIQLNVYDCGPSIQSLIATSPTKELLARYDSIWQPLITRVKRKSTLQVSTMNTPSGSNTLDTKLIGTWHKSSSSPSAYTNGVLTNLAYAGYTKGEYNFKTDGTYTFQGESWSGYYNSNEYRLLDESGIFAVRNNELVISPSTALYRVVDRDGHLKKSEKLSTDKRTYTWKTHYYEGLQETDLILSAKKENAIDGGFSSSEEFPNSFIYSPGKKLEFKFLPLKP